MIGTFWLDDAPEDRLRGRLEVDRRLLRVESGHLVDCMEIVRRDLRSVTREPRSDTNETYTIYGLLDSGTKVTIPHAHRGGCSHAPASIEQTFILLYVLEGAHVHSSDRYTEAEVMFGTRWQNWLLSCTPLGILELPDHGEVGLRLEDGLRFSGLPLLTHDELRRSVINPLLTLVTLMSGQDVSPPTLVLYQEPGISVTVRRPARPSNDTATEDPPPILSPESVGPLNLSAWYRLTHQLVPVTTLIAKTVAASRYDVEMRVLILAASAEAVHRGLYDQKKMSKQEAGKIRKHALAGVPEYARPRVENLLQSLRNLTYSERLHLLLERLESLADEVAGKASATENDLPEGQGVKKGRDLWVDSVKNARNGFAHMSRNSPEDLRRHAVEMNVLYESLRWTLTAVLLVHVGVPLEKIRDGFQQSSQYVLFRERAIYQWPQIFAFDDGFFSRQAGGKRWVPVRRRTDLDEAHASAVLAGIAEADWKALYHAYGPASDVPVLLGAVTVGDDATRAAAWWELWGNIHHQGSVYEATLPAVDPLIGLATWKTYPDRVEALRMLREVAGAEDVRVWHYSADGVIVHDEGHQLEVRSALLDAVEHHADELLGSWREESEAVRRAQLWLLSVLPAHLHRYSDLVDAVLPADYYEIWRRLVAGEEFDEEQEDRLDELEAWIDASDKDS